MSEPPPLPRRRTPVGCWVALVVVLLLVGGGYLLLRWGFHMLTDQVKVALQDLPAVQEHIGEIQDIDLDLPATGEDEREDVFVFRLRGTKGRGTVSVQLETVDADTERVLGGTLRLEGGRTIDLLPDDGSPPAEAPPPGG